MANGLNICPAFQSGTSRHLARSQCSQDGKMERNPQARHRMTIFVAAIFIIACCIAVYFAFEFHPGEPALPATGAVSTSGQ